MNLSLSGATDFVKAKTKTPAIHVFIPKLLCYNIHEKSMYIFTETIRLFVRFLPVFFKFSIFVSLALKIHNFTDPKLVRKQHWNFNEFNFYI
jgi:hypothetical protein